MHIMQRVIKFTSTNFHFEALLNLKLNSRVKISEKVYLIIRIIHEMCISVSIITLFTRGQLVAFLAWW